MHANKCNFTPPPYIHVAREIDLLFSQKHAKFCFGSQNAVSVRSTSKVLEGIDLNAGVSLVKRNGTDLKNFGKFNLDEVDLKTMLFAITYHWGIIFVLFCGLT